MKNMEYFIRTTEIILIVGYQLEIYLTKILKGDCEQEEKEHSHQIFLNKIQTFFYLYSLHLIVTISITHMCIFS